MLPLFQFHNAGFTGIAFWDIPIKLAYSLNFLRGKQSQKTSLASGAHVFKEASLNASWCRAITIYQFRLLGWDLLIPKVTSCFCCQRYQQRTKALGEGKNLRKHLVQVIWLCVYGQQGRILNLIGCFFILHTVLPPASYLLSPTKCGPWSMSIGIRGEIC